LGKLIVFLDMKKKFYRDDQARTGYSSPSPLFIRIHIYPIEK
jgi:hypothetical protein